jgi:hypothetical protein
MPNIATHYTAIVAKRNTATSTCTHTHTAGSHVHTTHTTHTVHAVHTVHTVHTAAAAAAAAAAEVATMKHPQHAFEYSLLPSTPPLPPPIGLSVSTA